MDQRPPQPESPGRPQLQLQPPPPPPPPGFLPPPGYGMLLPYGYHHPDTFCRPTLYGAPMPMGPPGWGPAFFVPPLPGAAALAPPLLPPRPAPSSTSAAADLLPADPFGTAGVESATEPASPRAAAQPPLQLPTGPAPPQPPLPLPLPLPIRPASSQGLGGTAAAAAGAAGAAAARPLPDRPPKLGKVHVTQASQLAAQRLHQLFPKLPPWVHGYLLHRLVAHFAQVSDDELLGGSRNPPGTPCQPILLDTDRAAAACNSIAYGPAGQVAAVAASTLEALRQQYLAGASEQELLALVARRFTWTKNKKLTSLLPGPATGSGGMEADLARLVFDRGCAEPQLQSAAGSASKRVLPPAPPPPLRGAVVGVPPTRRPLFGGGSGGQLLQRLLRQAVAELATALSLGAVHSGSGLPPAIAGQQPAETLVVGGDIDFGTVPVSCLTAQQLVEAAAAAAAGLPHQAEHSSPAAEAAGSLLDLLHLASTPQQQQPGSAAGGSQVHSASSGGSSTLLGGGAAAAGGPVLHFRQLVVENRSSGDELWLLGGVAAPSFPHTLAAIDDARLFWLDGHQAVRLGPKQQHTISVALSSADCAARRQEKGILQQLLLLVFAAAPHTRTAQALDGIAGAAVAECPADWAAIGAGSEAAAGAAAAGGGITADGVVAAPAAVAAAAAPAAAAAAAATAAPYRLFVVARRVTVALVDRPAELAFLMSADAKPFISERLRQLFSGVPNTPLNHVSRTAQRLLCTGQHSPEGSGQLQHPLGQPLALSQQGQALALACVPHAVPRSPAAPWLQRLRRLLLLEEVALEQDVTRFDQFNVRLRLALFDSGTANRCRLVSLTPSPAGEQRQQSTSIAYRGPTVGLLQPGGIAPPGTSLYALAVLDVPGMPEGRPALLLGDAGEQSGSRSDGGGSEDPSLRPATMSQHVCHCKG